MSFFSNLFCAKTTLPKINQDELSKVVLEAACSTLKEYREETTKEHLETCLLSEKNKKERQMTRNNRREAKLKLDF